MKRILVLIALFSSVIFAASTWYFDRANTIRSSQDKVFYNKIIEDKSVKEWQLVFDDNSTAELCLYGNHQSFDYAQKVVIDDGQQIINYYLTNKEKEMQISFHNNNTMLILHDDDRDIYFHNRVSK
ncbi:MAG: Unknown protein [uncultured Campylobacterales bacterium]|uniref:Uncharacterized protein n=1 Tax=uncultured Campylobacterales bacterium TaxID=352960 RepID=A0A6S6SCC5_9BACT|nr:MAG: Unknown protein [uncultured Campylobacterales bacterium]